ncbi:enoyl-CoA hydratase-related protein [Streptomyces sp. NPDC005409]|uniref:enoyl-CoA hydratase/isomerase family protein n=1 Tax=Streptomyces sp. NPDC005409 TaxID=3155342 RepID=UPI003454DF34
MSAWPRRTPSSPCPRRSWAWRSTRAATCGSRGRRARAGPSTWPLTGRRIDAATAERLHLVQLVVPAQDLEAAARTLAGEIAANAPLAVQGIKRAVDSYADAALPAALDRVAMTAALTLTSEDAREGYGAKAARRPPHFTGG